jgi:MoaA/NifB/PqqE/SkfB family radical SAM enzyme
MKPKTVQSDGYNYIFDPSDGTFLRWGTTLSDDPEMSPFGCEIADIEISTICHGVDNKVCKFCYKNNNPKGSNMSLETFKKVFANLPDNLTQIAFGVGDIDANPDLWEILNHCRNNNVIPNITINGDRMTYFNYRDLAYFCGAVAVSRYNPKDICYDAVDSLTALGMKQVNIHMLLSEETFEDILELVYDAKHDLRLENLNAIVFLSLKEQGRGKGFTRLSDEKFKQVLSALDELGISYGFDSCTAHKFLKNISPPRKSQVEQFIEPCESGLFSIYINVEGKAFPCSFTEFGDGIDVAQADDFIQDIWFSDMFYEWREKLLDNKRNCPVYKI